MRSNDEWQRVLTTLGDLLRVLEDAAENQGEALAVLESMLGEGRISIVGSEIAVAA